MIRLEDRRTIVAHIDSARQAGARLAKVSAVSRFDVPMFTYGDGCGG